jgi:hypothetical protein
MTIGTISQSDTMHEAAGWHHMNKNSVTFNQQPSVYTFVISNVCIFYSSTSFGLVTNNQEEEPSLQYKTSEFAWLYQNTQDSKIYCRSMCSTFHYSVHPENFIFQFLWCKHLLNTQPQGHYVSLPNRLKELELNKTFQLTTELYLAVQTSRMRHKIPKFYCFQGISLCLGTHSTSCTHAHSSIIVYWMCTYGHWLNVNQFKEFST